MIYKAPTSIKNQGACQTATTTARSSKFGEISALQMHSPGNNKSSTGYS